MEQLQRCYICQCIPENHVVYYRCKLNDEIICLECCWSLEKHIDVLEKMLNKNLEEVREICKKCDLRCVPEEEQK
jgi:hypothetical protein